MQLRNGIGAQRANWAKMPLATNGRLSHTRNALSFHTEEAGFLTCEGTSCDESVSLSSSPPHSEDFVDLGATWSLNLYAGTLGLTDQRARDR